jgi:hypothetical protein
MRRRLVTILSAAMLSTALLLPMAALPALADSAAVVLATEGHSSDAGLDPMKADDPDNAFAPKSYEANWTWRAGKGLLGLFLVILLPVGAMYYFRVARPARSNRS